MRIRLVLADDHPIVLDGLETLFRRESDFQVVARCVNGDEALQAVRRHRPDVLLLDIRMPRRNGLAVLEEMRKKKLPTRVVLVTAAVEKHEVLEALRLGVRGIVLEDVAPRRLVRCVRKVHAGEQWIEDELISDALATLMRREAGAREVADRLTRREIEMVRMVATGLRNKEMSGCLAITEGTVKIHLHNVYKKLKVQNRVELTLYAQSKGLA